MPSIPTAQLICRFLPPKWGGESVLPQLTPASLGQTVLQSQAWVGAAVANS